MGIHGLEESTTYTAVMDALRARFEGREQGREEERVANRRDFLRRTQLALLRNGQLVFGEPTPYIVATIESIDDLERLDMLGYLLLKVSSWDELMANTSA